MTTIPERLTTTNTPGVRRVTVRAPGGPEALEVVVGEPSPLGPGSLRVRVTAASVNFRDVALRRGDDLVEEVKYPIVPGSDFAGVVIEAAPDVTDIRFSMGTRVMGLALDGTYADEVIVPAVLVHPVPMLIDDVTAACLPVVGLTASFLCSSSGIGPGSKVVVWASAGGLGCFLGLMIRNSGALGIGISSSPEKQAVAESAGFEVVLSHQQPQLVERILEAVPDGATVVIDSVGGPKFSRSLKMVSDHGLVVLCGHSAGKPDLGSLGTTFIDSGRNLSLKEFSLPGHLLASLGDIPRRMDDLINVVSQHPNAIPVKTFALHDAASAHEELESGNSVGKLVLVS